MFDPTTAALIRAAPPLEGLDLDNLPKRLTEAFADIVSARIRLRGAPVDAEDEALVATVTELRRIAAAHETYAALLPDRENREAELRAADEVWMTSSTKEILAIATLDGKPVGTGKPGPYAEQMWQWYQDFKNTVMRKG